MLVWTDERPAYEAAHPEARRVSQALAPLFLADAFTTAQWAVRSEQSRQQQMMHMQMQMQPLGMAMQAAGAPGGGAYFSPPGGVLPQQSLQPAVLVNGVLQVQAQAAQPSAPPAPVQQSMETSTLAVLPPGGYNSHALHAPSSTASTDMYAQPPPLAPLPMLMPHSYGSGEGLQVEGLTQPQPQSHAQLQQPLLQLQQPQPYQQYQQPLRSTFCGQCGAPTVANNKFCGQCGARVDS